MSAEHVPLRPSWDCRCCGKPWPCDPAREHLAAEAPRTPLAVYMALQLYDAVREIPGASPEDMYERFIGWTNPGSRPVVDNRGGRHYA